MAASSMGIGKGRKLKPHLLVQRRWTRREDEQSYDDELRRQLASDARDAAEGEAMGAGCFAWDSARAEAEDAANAARTAKLEEIQKRRQWDELRRREGEELRRQQADLCARVRDLTEADGVTFKDWLLLDKPWRNKGLALLEDGPWQTEGDGGGRQMTEADGVTWKDWLLAGVALAQRRP